MKDSKAYPYLKGRVEDVMIRNPVTVEKGESIASLVELFTSHHYHGVPVVDSSGRLVGIVRDSEVLSIFAKKGPFAGEYRTVKDIMHVPPLVIGPKKTIQEAVLKTFKDGTRFLVVVDDSGAILGVITRIDLIRGIRWRQDPA
ncbi:MAG: CBS domain-containing protein [Actinobacteria bacterium]|nr:CBS domain-containing protein [Actinomycetota bacterium]